MRAAVPALLLLSPCLLTAAEKGGPAAETEPATRAIPAISLLPEGSILKGVMLPRYDKERKLVGLLKAEKMTLITTSRIFGETVVMELFNPDRTSRGRVDLATADFLQDKGLVQTRNPISIVSDRVSAEGTGLVYDLQQSKGFIIGPAITRISQPSPTAMNPASPALRATALLGASFLPLIAAPPAPPSAADVAQLQKDATSKAPEAAAANATTRKDLRSTLQASEDANKETLAFLEQADLLAAAAKGTDAPEAKPLEVTPDAELTIINSEAGFYFDSASGVFVYLKNVRVNDPRFHLTAANDLKIFFDKKEPVAKKDQAPEEKPAANKEKKDSLSFGGAGFGDPRKIVATGAVLMTEKNPKPGEAPLEVSGALFSYDIASGDIIISGGYPWFKRGAMYMRAKSPNALIRVDKNMQAVTEGSDWESGLPTNQKQDQKQKR